uniref:Cation/H+ exchanger domain-containing protein n=1 Tax=Parascaris univalens TaxID=6257 RepID=A0A915AGU3_PARUN
FISRLPLNEMEHVGSNFRNLAINVVNHRETNLALSSLIIVLSIYVTIVSVLRRPFVHPLIASTDFNETFMSEESIDYKYSTMSYIMLWLCAIIFGRIISFAKLPSLLGVLLVGIAFKNIPFMSGLLLLDKGISDVLRKAAFSIILIRIAMGFDTGLFRKANCLILRLGAISTLCEIIAITVTAHFIFCVDLRMAILFGIVLTASASAIIFPILANLMAEGYGIGSPFCDVLQSSVPLDNLLCICSLHIATAIVFAVDISYETGIMFAQLIVGIISGFIGGLVLWWLPRYDAEHTHFIRCAMLISTALAFLFGSWTIGCQSGGVFAIAVLTIIAVYRWKLDNRFKISKEEEAFTVIFQLFSMPVMFALIGYDFEITNAALPPQIVVRSFGTMHAHTAVLISASCVLAIIITAPIGQLLIFLGPRVLRVRDANQLCSNISTKEHQTPARTYPLSSHYL